MNELELYKQRIKELIDQSSDASDLKVIYSLLLKLQDCPKAG